MCCKLYIAGRGCKMTWTVILATILHYWAVVNLSLNFFQRTMAQMQDQSLDLWSVAKSTTTVLQFPHPHHIRVVIFSFLFLIFKIETSKGNNVSLEIHVLVTSTLVSVHTHLICLQTVLQVLHSHPESGKCRGDAATDHASVICFMARCCTSHTSAVIWLVTDPPRQW